ncbi:hypothetical protein LTR78_008082 [Recurvomyces mirabilis]|uniref:RanBD1 domain-containing protein n=1 Tax=Recurvomyces mirabilis TaxID=574656 RepID=A0AAE0TRD8_9PEZI|nr:hypothetical protein LTR78_008082 [Recurvomyces mirabilis]KAK5150809.1 hypothetical protein LTS14_009873 [Recurvomyces mirabilis]
MAPVAEHNPGSDTEGAEKPVREQLRKATIAAQGGMSSSGDAPSNAEAEGENGERGRVQRKRSFEEVETEQGDQPSTDTVKQHTRKRSRDSTAEEAALNDGRKVSGERPRESKEPPLSAGGANGNGLATNKRPVTPDEDEDDGTNEVAAESVASPKTKRSRLHSTTAEDSELLASAAQPANAKDGSKDASAGSAIALTKLPAGSAFANTSTTSPFGALSGSKSPQAFEQPASTSAFTSSAFGSAAGSVTSGFGAIGKTTGGFGTGGSFATGSKSSSVVPEAAKENEALVSTSSSTFGGALGQKSAFLAGPSTSGGFGSASSGFGQPGGGLGSGFGSKLRGTSAFGSSAGGLTSFASSKAPTPLGGTIGSSSKALKPFGAPAEEEAEADNGGEDEEGGVKSPPLSQDADQQDERFHEQHIETGEEDEEMEFSCRAKLYNYSTATKGGKKEWRERGLGVLRLNVNRAAGTEGNSTQARFLMRADGSHRVVLNTPVKKEISFGAAAGGPPQGGLMLFMGTVDGKTGLEMLQLKMRQQYALELHEKIVELQKEM